MVEYKCFRKKLLKLTRPSGSSVFRCHNPKVNKLLTRLRLGLSHLWEHKFKHGFLDSLNPICNCGQDIEISTHFLLHCSNYSSERVTVVYILRDWGQFFYCFLGGDKKEKKREPASLPKICQFFSSIKDIVVVCVFFFIKDVF